jgi:tRNA-2-methylthio-N6-dimethylallyladenosine synthase
MGPQSYHTLPELVAKAARERGHFLNLDFPAEPKFDMLPEDSQAQGVSAFLAIQEGCDKFCTFCVVPYTRGAEYSRPVSDIYREAQRMAAQGAQEITLLGQNVNAYHGVGESAEDIWPLGKLIRQLATIDGVSRIRYTTSHPRDMMDELIEAHGSIPKLMPFLHLPIQSGSDKILKEMNRKHSRGEYLDVIARLRAARPDIAFSSDFIVGFPGETEEDFSETLAIVREVGYAQCYSFAYSPRPGTPASVKTTQVPQEVKLERLARLQAAISEQQLAFNKQTVGQVMDVLFDRPGKYAGQMIGRSPYMQSVHVHNASAYAGKMVTVTVTEAFEHSVGAVVVEENA